MTDTPKGYDAEVDTMNIDKPASLPGMDETSDFVRKLRGFETAYSEQFFRPLSKAERLEIGPVLLSRASAGMGRHLAQFFNEAADIITALSERAHYAEGTAQTNIDRAEAAEAERDALILDNARYVQANTDLLAKVERMEKALKPFATVGSVIDGPFGPALFAEDEMAFKSGCAWSENGTVHTLTWGHFRAARSALNLETKE